MSDGALNWREVQAEHHLKRARLFACYAAAYESEARSCDQKSRRGYLFRRARQFSKDAELRLAKAKELAKHLTGKTDHGEVERGRIA